MGNNHEAKIHWLDCHEPSRREELLWLSKSALQEVPALKQELTHPQTGQATSLEKTSYAQRIQIVEEAIRRNPRFRAFALPMIEAQGLGTVEDPES